MDQSSLRVPKRQMPVRLWVHPEGQVIGSIFLHLGNPGETQGEQPADVLNEKADFLVVKRDDPEELRFYNKSSIVRVEYWEGNEAGNDGSRPMPCRLTLMDGSLIEGSICKSLPAERSRLYDYMNDTSERFLKLDLGGSEVALINKSYVVCITAADLDSGAGEPEEPGGGPDTDGPLELAA